MSKPKRGRKKLSPYQRIVRAAKAGCAVHLSPAEVFQMSLDTAINTLAMADDANTDGIDGEPRDEVSRMVTDELE